MPSFSVKQTHQIASLLPSCSEDGALGYLKQSKEFRETHMKSTRQSHPSTSPHSSAQSVSLYVANVPRSVSKVSLLWLATIVFSQCAAFSAFDQLVQGRNN